MIDWQNIAVILIVMAALIYVARRGWTRLQSFRASGMNSSSCASQCGRCSDEAAPQPKKALVQLSRTQRR